MAQRKTSTKQNITLSADKELIESARKRARAMKTTLNEEFRNWLMQFTKSTQTKDRYRDLMEQFADINSGKKFARHEFYEK